VTTQIQVERRVGQRFGYLLPVTFCTAGVVEGRGFTQDLSSRGVFFFTDVQLTDGLEIELTIQMPSEITLGESMRVRCKGRVLRVVKPAELGAVSQAGTKIGVAVRLEVYDYLPEAAEPSAAIPRVSALHTHREKEQPSVRPSVQG